MNITIALHCLRTAPLSALLLHVLTLLCRDKVHSFISVIIVSFTIRDQWTKKLGDDAMTWRSVMLKRQQVMEITIHC